MIRSAARTGQIQMAWVAFLASIALLAGLVVLLYWDPFVSSPSQPNQPLVLYCAAGIKAPVEKAVREYEQAYGVTVQLQYGGSQTLLSGLEVARRGDLFLPGDDSYLLLGRDKGLVAEILPLARMKPVLAVRKGNPLDLKTLNDVLAKKVKLAQAKPEAAAVGKLAREALQKAGRWEDVKKLFVVDKLTVNDVANDIVVGTVDAGIVWDATVKQYPDLEMLALPELADASARVSVGVLKSTSQPTAALRLARYLAAADRGLPHFRRTGFEPVDGDRWAERPEIHLLAGAMLRPAIAKTIAAFEEREGVRVTTVYDGCGILVGSMRTGKASADVFFACDSSFMDQVHDLFLDPVAISQNQLVILVPKGNPHNIRVLRDLAKPGLRIGVGHEKQCALGVLTQKTLVDSKLQDPVMKNVEVQLPTGDGLVNALRVRSLDAVIAYLSNAAEAGDELVPIAIDIPCAIATQPIAVAKESAHKHLTGRLLDAIRTEESRERFEALKFRWAAMKAERQP
jgi:molybdate transport system substrate-binding protein